MAATILTPVVISRVPSVISWTDLGAEGIQFKNTGKEFVVIRRDQASTSTITFATSYTYDNLPLPDLTVAMAAGDSTEQFKPVGPFPTDKYNGSDGYLKVTSDDSNDMIAVFSLSAVN